MAKINWYYAKATAGLSNENFDIVNESFSDFILIKNKNKEQLWNEIIEGEKILYHKSGDKEKVKWVQTKPTQFLRPKK